MLCPTEPKIFTSPPQCGKEETREAAARLGVSLLDTGYTPGGFCTLTGKRQKKTPGFGEFLKGFALMKSRSRQQPSLSPAGLHSWIILEEPRWGWKTKPPELQGLSQWMPRQGSAEPQSLSILPSSAFPGILWRRRGHGGSSFVEGRCESSCGARRESQTDPLGPSTVGISFQHSAGNKVCHNEKLQRGLKRVESSKRTAKRQKS